MPRGHYEILRPIGAGGMAELYLARLAGADGASPLVVLKRILPHFARDTAFIEMFLNEARIAATLQHPNLVAVTDFGQRDGDYFITMEYVHGGDLGELLEHAATVERFPLEVALTILQHACAGLHHAHERTGIDGQLLELVHRDVSPSNVMVSYDGAIKVTDFGIATAAALTRTTQAGTLKGKVSYMAPEQCKGGRIDRRADVFALGILLYETTLLTRLFVGENDYALMNQVIEGRVTPPRDVDPDYPPALEAIVMRALDIDPRRRFATADDMQHAIEGFAVSHGLQLSTNIVAGFVGHVLGPRPHPAVELASASIAGATRIVMAPRRPARRGWAFVAGAIGLVGAAIGGVALARPDTTRVQDRTPATATAPPEVILVPTPVPVLPTQSEPFERPSGGEVPTIVELPEVAEVEGDTDLEELIVIEDEATSESQTRTHKRRRPATKSVRTYDLDEAAPPR